MPADAEPIWASCAICGAPAEPECPHEHERLKLALDQATARWSGVETARKWVLDHARRHVIATFHALAEVRHQQFLEHLQTLPCYTVYQNYGAQALPPVEVALLLDRINHARATYQAAIDGDWRGCCLRYPDVLDYFFGLVEMRFPREDDDAVRRPRFVGGGAGAGISAMGFATAPLDAYGASAAAAAAAEAAAAAAAAAGYHGAPRVATRRRSSGSLDRKERRRKDKRRSSRERGTPPLPSHVPPLAPMPGQYHHSHSHSRRDRY